MISRFRLLILGGCLSATLFAAPQHARLMREAAAANKAGDPATALAKLEAAAQLRPDYPRLQLNLARTYAALGRAAEATAALQRLVEMGLHMDLTNDAGLAPLKDSPGAQSRITALQHDPI